MSDVERIFQEYAEAHRERGTADPRPYLARVEGPDREALRILIDEYLQRAPGRPWDQEAFAAARATPFMQDVARLVEDSSGRWPELLPELRNRAKLRRADLVARLAAALGVAGREQKVGFYYHRMEQGLLPERGVSDRVIEALSTILGEPAEELRRAGRMVRAGGDAGLSARVMARTAQPAEVTDAARLAVSEAEAVVEPEPGPDEVDRLFTGG